MTIDTTRAVVERLYDALAAGAAPEAIADLFTDDARFDMPGDTGNVSWIGIRTGRQGVIDFVIGLREGIESVRFDVDHIFTDGDKAVVIGDLESRVRSTGKLIYTRHATEMLVRDGKIASYFFFEDSFAVSQAVQS